MKKIYYIVIISLIAVSCSDFSDIGPNSPDRVMVKSETKLLSRSDHESIIYYKEYSKEQNLIFAEFYDEEGTKTTVSNYEYQDGNTVEVQTDLVGNQDKIIEYEYDDKGFLLEERELNSNGEVSKTIRYNYDDRGNLLSKELCLGDGNCIIIEQRENRYTETGQLESIYSIDTETGVKMLTDSLVYTNNSGIDLISFNEAGDIKSFKKINYNEIGLPESEVVQNSAGEIIKMYKFLYTYYH